MLALVPALIGAVLIGLSLGFLGSGGSILTVPVLSFLVGMKDKQAIANSIAIVGLIALFGALPHIRRKRVDYLSLLLFGLPGGAGMAIGVWVAKEVPGWVQLATFAVVMAVAAYFMFRPNRTLPGEPREKTSALDANRLLLIATEGLAVGALTGFVGVGGGFLIVPALVLLAGLPMSKAVGTSLLIIALKSGVGVAKHWNNPQAEFDWTIIGLFVVFGAAGSFVAAKLSKRVNNDQLRLIFAWFLVALAPVILIKSLLNQF